MFIVNNSKTQSWKSYKIDGHILDIECGSTFEVSNEVGFKLLKLLGASGWLEECEAPKEKAPKEEAPKEEVKEKKAEEKQSKKI